MSIVAPQDGFAEFGSDDPRREIQVGIAVSALFFVGLLGSAAFLPLDQANMVPAAMVVAGHRQAIQSREGGVVTALKVADGDQVHAGELLVSFGAADALAVERSLTSRVITKHAEIARLRAEQMGNPVVTLPPEAVPLTAEDRAEADRVLAVAQIELNAQRAANTARRAVLSKRVQEAGEQMQGYRRQLSSNTRQQELNDQELVGMRSLQAQGYAPATRVRELERSGASLMGDAGAETAEVARLEATQGESRLQISEGDAERSKEVADELDKAQSELQELLPQLSAARETLARTEIRAPVSGAVVAPTINMVGAVVAPGQRLMEIVPARADYVVEAHVSPREIEGFRVGKTIKVQMVGLHDRHASALEGTVTHVAADALPDEKTGLPFYTVSASIPQREVRRLPAADDAALRPGMPVSMTATVQKRTALQYLISPLVQSLAGGMHER